MADRCTASEGAASSRAEPRAGRRDLDRSNLARVVKSVAQVLRPTLDDTRDGALPDRIAVLVTRLHEGPLGRAGRNSHRAAA